MSNNVATFDFSNLDLVKSDQDTPPVIDVHIEDIVPEVTEKPTKDAVIDDLAVSNPMVEDTIPDVVDKPINTNSNVIDILKEFSINSIIYDNENGEEEEVPIEDADIDINKAIELIKLSHEQEIEELKEKSLSVESIDNDRKEIIEFIVKGGDPKKLFDLQEDLKEVKQYDLGDENDAEEVIRKYYSYKPDTSKEEVDTFIAGAKAQGTLTNLAETAADKITEYVEKLKESEKNQLNELVEKRKEALKTYTKDLKTEVKNLGYTDKVYNKIVDFATKTVKRKTNDGQDIEVYEMDEAISKIRNNPKDAADLAAFILDKPLYLKKQFESREIELKKELSKKIRISRTLNSNSAEQTKTSYERNTTLDKANLIPLD